MSFKQKNSGHPNDHNFLLSCQLYQTVAYKLVKLELVHQIWSQVKQPATHWLTWLNLKRNTANSTISIKCIVPVYPQYVPISINHGVTDDVTGTITIEGAPAQHGPTLQKITPHTDCQARAVNHCIPEDSTEKYFMILRFIIYKYKL